MSEIFQRCLLIQMEEDILGSLPDLSKFIVSMAVFSLLQCFSQILNMLIFCPEEQIVKILLVLNFQMWLLCVFLCLHVLPSFFLYVSS